MKNIRLFLLISLCLILLISSCQMRLPMGVNGLANSTGTNPITSTPRASSTPIPPLFLKNTVEPPTPTPLPAEEAITSVQAYFSALETQDYQTASELLSTFGLSASNLNRQDAYKKLVEQAGNGVQWSGLQIKDSQTLNDQTILVHVLYQLTSKDPKTGKDLTAEKDEIWPLRLESGQWLYNWDNLVDFKTLNSLDSQSAHRVRVQLKRLDRYTDRLVLNLAAQNASNKPVYWGQTRQGLGSFHFGDQTVSAEKDQILLNRMQTYPDLKIEVKGLFPKYPDSIDLIQWKDSNEPPWYSFIITQ